ncbi:DUF1624 domain-containing protein [Ohtaekwangia koreensis]|uniref:Uncharacterized membrane protein n=1 Tax=Ohtaekwangia koreensis TaxID=688867 RepID=A0A1T5M361_9BACT|nr:heparan-alpha-glucosaminide N-acetyltransferase domain-containing protein [Ohtaekwangia koreensis]SKC82299.1 Uncharacterized membrane protein [Ohtaekwangia koreensis]
MSTVTLTTPHPFSTTLKSSNRIESIDLLRGLVMVIMALDHVRDYFHADAFLFNPADLNKTTAAIFMTRWITHFCAPVFVFLAGTSAFMVGSRKGKKELSAFLLKRGVWLIVLEFTVLNFAWFFNIHFSLIALTVIWALAIGMISLALFIHLPFKAILVLGVLLVAGHNILDPIHVAGQGADAMGWSLLHEQGGFRFPFTFVFVGYPIIPWIGVMLLGYCFGSLYQPTYDASTRKRILLSIGGGAVVLFVLLRLLNIYGDPHAWSVQKDPLFTFLSFINVTKYPPSLLYVLITLGPALIFLAISERYKGKLTQALVSLGRVPMFYYILHLYVIHILAVIAAILTGYTLSDMVFNTWVTDSPALKGYGFSLGTVYLVWIAVVLALYPLCKWYDTYKINHREQWWLSYL